MSTLQQEPALTTSAYRLQVRAAFEPFRDQVGEWERAGHLPRELFTALGAAGIFRQRWAAGPAGGLALAMEMVEELSPVNGGAALAVSIHSEVFTHALHRFGGPAHVGTRDDALAGQAVGCVAITEPSGGSDLYSMQTAAVRTTAGGWQLTGTKRFTTNAGCATHALVLARTGSLESVASLFLVPLDQPGVRIARFLGTLGVRSADTAAIEFDLRLTDDAVVGRVDAGLLYALKLLDYERIFVATGLVASARAALALATVHMRTRTQFGKRLFDHQALAHRVAERWAETEAAAALIDAACRAARGDHLPHHLVAAAKLVAARAGIAAIDEAIQIFGGRGFTEDYPLERMYRDARLARIGGGTDEMMCQVIGMHLDVPDPVATATLERIRATAEEP